MIIKKLKFAFAVIEKLIDGAYHAFIEDIVDGEHTLGSPQAISADTVYRFTVDGAARDFVVAPDYITSRWDKINSKFAVPEELNTPMYVANLGFVFDPTSNNEGHGTIRAYIDDTVPKLIHTGQFNFKGSADSAGGLVTWYMGTETGYDAKNDGVYFELEFNLAGVLYGKTLTIYRT